MNLYHPQRWIDHPNGPASRLKILMYLSRDIFCSVIRRDHLDGQRRSAVYRGTVKVNSLGVLRVDKCHIGISDRVLAQTEIHLLDYDSQSMRFHKRHKPHCNTLPNQVVPQRWGTAPSAALLRPVRTLHRRSLEAWCIPRTKPESRLRPTTT